MTDKKLKKTKLSVVIFLVVAILVTSIVTVLSFGKSDEAYRTITVIEVTGTVGVVHNNTEYQAYTGMHLEEGYAVVTSGNSYIRLLLDDDKYVKLESGSKATFEEVRGGKTAIRIERGSIVAEVTRPLEIDEDFIVNTPNAVLAVRGTLFRVDLSRNEKGELNTDVMTYGGAVSSKRVQPDGKVEDIELTIKQGFKATVNMDDKETVYLVDDIKVDLSGLVGTGNNDTTITETDVNGEIVNVPITLESILKPIIIEEIPDEDLVDIYFASENGHSMFVEMKDISEQLETREIDITQKTSVYEVAEKIENPVEIVIPDDNIPLATTTEGVTEPAIMVQGPPTDGLGETTEPTATTVPVTTEPTTVLTTESTTKPIVSTTEQTTKPTVSTTEPTTEETTEPTTVHNHTKVTEEVKPTCTKAGKVIVKCSECGEILSEKVLEKLGHTTEITTVNATCTVDGKKTEKCIVCGEIISETILEKLGHTTEIITVNATCTEDGKETEKCTVCSGIVSETILPSTGHKSIYSGTQDAHTECEICHEILSTSHTYTTNTVDATCTQDGGTNYICECGYNYTDIIPQTGHTEINAGEPDAHTKCDVCGETLKDGTSHSYTDTETILATCTTVGELTHTCSCGWSYTEEIPAGHKKSDDGTTCSGCGEIWVDLNSTNFPDSMFLSYLSTTYDADGNNALIGDEVTGVVTINVSGNSTTDGGYTDLTGIENFTNLTTVNCAYNSAITSLDLSGFTNLVNLDITGLTNLKTLDVSNTSLEESKIIGLETCTALEELNLSETSITAINLNAQTKLKTVDLGNCSSLTSFVIDDNSTTYALSSIDLSGCTSLETLTINNALSLTTVDFTDLSAIKTIDLGGCQGITGVVDVSNKTNLTTLTIAGLNRITSLKLGGCSNLATLDAVACTQLTTIQGLNSCATLTTLNLNNTGLTSVDVTSNNALVTLNVANCSSLVYLDATRSTESTTLSSLTVTNCTALKTLNIYNCKGVTTLDATTLTELEELNLTYSGVTSFNNSSDTMDFSSNTSLKNIYLNGISSFTGVDVSANTLLEEFSLVDNAKVTSLDFSNNARLKKLTLSDVTALNTLNVAGCTSLESFNVLNTALTSLSVTGSSALTQFWVYNNTGLQSLSLTGATNLTSVKLSAGTNNTSLKSLTLTDCGIASLDVSYLTALTTLDVSGCASLTSLGTVPTTVTTLNVTGTGITSLDASACTELTTLDITDCTSLETLDISNTKISGLSIDDTYTSLASVALNNIESTSGIFSINNNNVETVTAQSINVQSFGVTSTSVTSIDLTGSTIGTGGMMSFSISNCGSSLQTLTVSNSNLTILPTETMSALKTLNAENCTGLTSIDMVTMPNIETLDISGCTGITEIDVSVCASLVNLDVSGTAITALEANYSLYMETVDVSNCTSLEGLVMDQESNNNLTSVNVSGCTSMMYLQIANSNSLQELDLSGLSSLSAAYLTDCTAITSIDISDTQMSDISSLNISTLNNFKTLKASNADLSDSELADMLKTSLEVIDISDNSAVTTIDLTGFVNLKNLDVSNTGITALDTSECTLLETIDASNCTQLDYFVMSTGSGETYSGLSLVDVSGCTGLTLFQLSDASNLESLDLSTLESLEELYVQNCPEITSLDISSSTNISSVNVVDSGLTSGAIALPPGKDESIIIGLT